MAAAAGTYPGDQGSSVRVKRLNGLTAVACGVLPAAFLVHLYPPKWPVAIASFILGLLWANGFEYVYHRWILHWPKSELGKGHLLHHATVGTPLELEHVTFGASPFSVVMIFVINGVPAALLDVAVGARILPGILIAFTLYFIAVEEIHWRIHLGGWLPRVLRATPAYHLGHHETPNIRFNVFLPIFDLLFGNVAPAVSQTQPASIKRHSIQAAVTFCCLALQETIVLLYLIAVSIFFWCMFPHLGENKSRQAKPVGESPVSRQD